MFSIAFICTANMCRSVMAHAIAVSLLKERGWPVAVYSGGTMDMFSSPPADDARVTCIRHGTPPQKKRSTFVLDLPLSSIDRFFVMERHHFESLVEAIPPAKLTFLGAYDPQHRGDEIEDPMGQESAAFERCYGLIKDCIENYLDTTTEIPGTPNYAA